MTDDDEEDWRIASYADAYCCPLRVKESDSSFERLMSHCVPGHGTTICVKTGEEEEDEAFNIQDEHAHSD